MSQSPVRSYRAEVRRRAAAAAQVPDALAPVDDRTAGWLQVPAQTIGEALLQAWWVNGIDHVFFTSGSDIAWMQEMTTKLRAAGRPGPELVTMIHENASVNAACGFTQVANRPAATAAHVELGTLNYGDGIHTASRGRHPVLISSGQTPTAYAGTAPGDRGQEPVWKQDLADYGSILRQYVKWDQRLTSLENPGLTSGRALQLAMTGPRGPVYMSLPRDVALTPVPSGALRFPTADQLGLADPPGPDPDAIAEAAEILLNATNPWMTATVAGRDPRVPGLLAQLADLLAIPYAETGSDTVNFPGDHPLYDAADALGHADVVFAIESMVPWIPHYNEPAADARVVTLGIDPVYSRNQSYEYTADVRLAADPYLALVALRDELDRRLTDARRGELVARRERLAAQGAARRDAAEQEARTALEGGRITPAHAAWQLSRALPEDVLLLNTAVSHGAIINRHLPGITPGSRLKAGSAGGGWGPGAALGAKLAAPDRFVALTVGDGFFQFGVPNAALWAAVRHRAPFLAVVFQNGEWTTGTRDVRRQFPDGASVTENTFEGGVMDPPPDLALLAQSVGAAGENVSDPDILPDALVRAVRTVREGTPAVVAIAV